MIGDHSFSIYCVIPAAVVITLISLVLSALVYLACREIKILLYILRQDVAKLTDRVTSSAPPSIRVPSRVEPKRPPFEV